MNKLEEILNTELQEVQYIGEDGGMVVDGRLSFKEAYKRMKKRWTDDCGEEEAREFFRDWCTEVSVGIGYLHLIKDEDKHKYEDDVEWYVSVKEESPYKVWVYWG